MSLLLSLCVLVYGRPVLSFIRISANPCVVRSFASSIDYAVLSSAPSPCPRCPCLAPCPVVPLALVLTTLSPPGAVWTCDIGHPSCLVFSPELAKAVTRYPWQCNDCKRCRVCNRLGDDVTLRWLPQILENEPARSRPRHSPPSRRRTLERVLAVRPMRQGVSHLLRRPAAGRESRRWAPTFPSSASPSRLSLFLFSQSPLPLLFAQSVS